jgi:hypothetical protein
MLTVNRLERFARGIVEGSLPPIEGVDNPQTGTDESVPCPSQFVLASRKHSVIERDSESSRERKEPDSTSTLRGEVGFLQIPVNRNLQIHILHPRRQYQHLSNGDHNAVTGNGTNSSGCLPVSLNYYV